MKKFASAVASKSGFLANFVGFINGPVRKIARPSKNAIQNVVINGHKRAHVLKLQAVNKPDGTFMHCSGPLEGRRHDRTLYARSELDAQLDASMIFGHLQH